MPFIWHIPLLIGAGDYNAADGIVISVEAYWFGSPRQDYTVKVYSADGNDVKDGFDRTNMLHADGQSPSEFDSNNYVRGSSRLTVGVPRATNTVANAVVSLVDAYNSSESWETFCGYVLGLFNSFAA